MDCGVGEARAGLEEAEVRTPPASGLRPLRVIGACVLVGAIYSLASLGAAALLGPLSHLQPTPGNAAVWWLAGTLICFAVAPFVLRSTWTRVNTILAVWAVLAFVRSIGLGIEGYLFTHTEATVAVVGAAMGVLIGLVVAWLMVAVLWNAARAPLDRPAQARTAESWIWRILLVGLVYVVLYLVTGSANALLYTRSFYENNPAYALALPPVGAIFLALLIRGPLFGLGSFFVARSAHFAGNRSAVWLGLLLFVVGGLSPYLETTFRTMPLGFSLATLMELFLQNFLTGVVAARLYKGSPALPSSSGSPLSSSSAV
jgi:hypothetical protein